MGVISVSKMHIGGHRPGREAGPKERKTDMKRWDGLVDGYLRQGEVRGLSEETLVGVRSELDRWGCWLKRRRPRPSLEEVDAELIIQYIVLLRQACKGLKAARARGFSGSGSGCCRQ